MGSGLVFCPPFKQEERPDPSHSLKQEERPDPSHSLKQEERPDPQSFPQVKKSTAVLTSRECPYMFSLEVARLAPAFTPPFSK